MSFRIAGISDNSDDSEDDFNTDNIDKYFNQNSKTNDALTSSGNTEDVNVIANNNGTIENQHPKGDKDDQNGEPLAECNNEPLQDLNSFNEKTKVEEKNNFSENNNEQDLEFKVLSSCMIGDINVIDDYVNSGHDVNKYLHTGWTLLLYASSASCPEVVEHLLKLGAEQDKHKDGFTPLMAVCNSIRATEEKIIKCIELLINAKADPDASNKERRTPLMFACQTQGVSVVTELLKYVKNINNADNDGRSAIFDAVCANNIEVVKVLLDHGASTSIVDRRGSTVKEIADLKNFKEISKILDCDDDHDNNFCPIVYAYKWKDSLTLINHVDSNGVDSEVANILYALSLDSYKPKFTGMNLKTFLQLSEDDLIKLGMDIQYHRKQFLNGLLKFHSAKWKPQSLKKIDRNTSFSIFDGFVFLTSISRQLGVIGSGFAIVSKYFYINNPNKIIKLENNQKKLYKKEVNEIENLITSIKNDLQKILQLSNKIKRNSNINPPPMYIESPKPNNTTKWTVLTASIISGLLLYKIIPIKQQ